MVDVWNDRCFVVGLIEQNLIQVWIVDVNQSERDPSRALEVG